MRGERDLQQLAKLLVKKTLINVRSGLLPQRIQRWNRAEGTPSCTARSHADSARGAVFEKAYSVAQKVPAVKSHIG